MTREQKRAADLRKMAKAADYYASMGGRGPKKGSKEYQKRIDYVKGALAAVKQERKDQRAQSKMDKQKPPRKPVKKSAPKPTSRGGGRRSMRDY